MLQSARPADAAPGDGDDHGVGGAGDQPGDVPGHGGGAGDAVAPPTGGGGGAAAATGGGGWVESASVSCEPCRLTAADHCAPSQ